MDLAAGRAADTLLWDEAQALYQQPSGSRAELLGALVLYGLAEPAMRPKTLRASGRLNGSARAVGEWLAVWVYEVGIRPDLAVSVVDAAFRALAKPAKAAPAIPDPMPGLRLNGETYPEWAVRHNGRLQNGEVGAARMAWQAAQAAYDRGEGERWASGDGKALGASWTATEAVAVAQVVLPDAVPGSAPGEG